MRQRWRPLKRTWLGLMPGCISVLDERCSRRCTLSMRRCRGKACRESCCCLKWATTRLHAFAFENIKSHDLRCKHFTDNMHFIACLGYAKQPHRMLFSPIACSHPSCLPAPSSFTLRFQLFAAPSTIWKVSQDKQQPSDTSSMRFTALSARCVYQLSFSHPSIIPICLLLSAPPLSCISGTC